MVYDVIIIGSGPAGLTAATYCSRDNLKTLVLGGGKWGGQLMQTSEVENFPGFPQGILGPELMENMKQQMERFGAEVKLVNVTKVDFSHEPFKLWSGESDEKSRKYDEKDHGNCYEGKSVIIATGADTVWLGLPNEQKLIGKGVSSCAPCDAFFFRGKKVAVVGGGDAAMEEAITLAKFASEVIIVHRRNEFRASKIMVDRTLSLPNVRTCMNSAVIDVLGKDKVEGVVLESTGLPDHRTTLEVDGVFVAIGHVPNTGIFNGKLELDEKGYIVKSSKSKVQSLNDNYQMMTSVDGVFVAGDVHDHHFKQAVTAAAFGCMAALEVSRYLSEQK